MGKALQTLPIRILSGGWGQPWENAHTDAYAKTVFEILIEAGYDVAILSCQTAQRFFNQITRDTIAYNCLFGRFGEDGVVAGLCEFLGISYTGSGPLASALAMDKARCASFLTQYGIHIPKAVLLTERDLRFDSGEIARILARKELHLRKDHRSTGALVVKPNQSSFGSGVAVISEFDQLPAALNCAKAFSESVIVQEFISGITIHVPVLSGKSLTPVEVEPGLTDGELSQYSFRSARNTYRVPARLDEVVVAGLCDAAQTIYRALGCKGLTRSDFRVTSEGTAFLLEVNCQHSIRPNSIGLMSARCSGLSDLALVESVLEDRWIPGSQELRG
jgi:D-alanine-D-alanine ligase